MRGMEKKLDITGEQVGTPRPKSSEDWRKKALYNLSRTSGAAQESISSSSSGDLKPDVGIASSSKRQELRERRWLEGRRSGGVMSQSGDITRYRLQNQGNEVESRPNERKSDTSVLGQRKGGGGETSKKPGEESSEQQEPMDRTAGDPTPQRHTRVATPWEELKSDPPTKEDEKRWAEQAEIDRKEREARIHGK